MLPDGQVGFITHLLEPRSKEKGKREEDKAVSKRFYSIQVSEVAPVQGSHQNINWIRQGSISVSLPV